MAVLTGTVQDVRPPYGFIQGDDGIVYHFLLKRGRLANGPMAFQRDEEPRAPTPGERVIFEPSQNPPQPGKKPSVSKWAFAPNDSNQAPAILQPEVTRHRLLVTSGTAPQPSIKQLVLDQSQGNFGAMNGMLLLAETLDEVSLRAFCAIAPKGEALWLDFKRRRNAGENAGYGWPEYATDFLRENILKLASPKSCLLPEELSGVLWGYALSGTERPSGQEALDLHNSSPQMMERYAPRVCPGCNIAHCVHYKTYGGHTRSRH